MTPAKVSLLLGALLATSACGGGLIRSGSDPEVAELERQVVELKRRATVSELEVARLRQEVSRLEAELTAARAEAARRPPRAEPEGVTLPGSAPRAAPEPQVEETDLEPPPVAPPPSAAPPPAAEMDAAEAAEAQRLYDEAYTLFHQQRYAEAEERFLRYVDRYPATELADNALFWVGECRYARGDFPSALDAFTDTVERYPEGNKVGDALLKAGKCLESLGKSDQARGTYEELIRRFPNSAAAAMAEERLEALR